MGNTAHFLGQGPLIWLYVMNRVANFENIRAGSLKEGAVRYTLGRLID